jgi:ABC-type dipeptide/oligopeptide/nickel transport system permease component
VVVGTCSLAAWDEPLAGSSFPSLFLGVILWVFFRAHTRWVPILGLESHGAIEHQ